MPLPLPPVVCGPITPISPEVKVSGALKDAKITVLANHNSTQTAVGTGAATAPGDLWVTLSQQPKVGWSVVAVQEIGGEKSEPSPQAVVVIDTPPLATPVIVSDLNTCMADVLADGLTPGATIVADIAGKNFAKTPISRPLQWIGLDQTKTIAANSLMEVHQEATIGGQPLKSPIWTSLPIQSLKLETLPPPDIALPLEACRTTVTIASATPGAILQIENGGMSESTVSPRTSFTAQGFPLKEGPLVASQRMPRCNLKRQDAKFTVGPASQPPTPLVQQPICPKVPCFVASQLVPGATLTVVRYVKLSANSSQFGADHVFGIGHETETIYLGSKGMELTDPLGLVSFKAYQTLCNVSSKGAEITVAAPGGPFLPPKIIEPVYGCARAIRASGAHPGAWVQAFDGATKLPLSDATLASAPEFLLKLWFPIVAGTSIVLRQTGCNADGNSPSVSVKKIPSKLPTPTIKAPVRPGTNAIQLSGVIAGAHVFLLVDGVLRAQADCWTDTPTIYLSGALLAENQKIFAIQAMCDQLSPKEGPSVTVTKGNMKVSVSSASIPRGTTSNITVTALDADTGAPVPLGEVLIKGQPVAVTGQQFPYTPSANEPSPLQGEVRENVGHYPAPFQIALTDLQWLVHNLAGPTSLLYADTIIVSVDEATWILTPDWNPGLAATVTVASTPPNIDASTQFSAPTGAVKTMTVQLQSLKCSVPGYGTIPGIGSTVKIGYVGKKTKISWLILVDEGYDENGNPFPLPRANVTTVTDY